MTLTSKDFGNGMTLYSLTNKNGVILKVTDFGARIVQLAIPTNKKELRSIVLGFDSTRDYLENDLYFGATIGRTAGRIIEGTFTLDNLNYQTTVDPLTKNTLHGGSPSFESKKWSTQLVQSEPEPAITFCLKSPDGENGFPGNLTVSVTYTLTDNNECKITYHATADVPSIFNPTNHVYFNLTGDPTQSVADHELLIQADEFIPLKSDVTPLGVTKSVENTAFDFQKIKKIKEALDSNDSQILMMGGLDHPFILTNHDLIHPDVLLISPDQTIQLELYTDQPAVVLFSANFSDSTLTFHDKKLVNHGGLTLETQIPPGAERFHHFGDLAIRPEKPYDSTTMFKVIF
ncbi:galactose-1-epimerase [Carnobacterium divergens]